MNSRFQNEDVFKLHSVTDKQVVYIGNRNKPLEERKARFLRECQDGFIEISFLSTGYCLPLILCSHPPSYGCQGAPHSVTSENLIIDKENHKVYLTAPMILDGVPVCWKGWINMQTLEGMGRLIYDERAAMSMHQSPPKSPPAHSLQEIECFQVRSSTGDSTGSTKSATEPAQGTSSDIIPSSVDATFPRPTLYSRHHSFDSTLIPSSVDPLSYATNTSYTPFLISHFSPLQHAHPFTTYLPSRLRSETGPPSFQITESLEHSHTLTPSNGIHSNLNPLSEPSSPRGIVLNGSVSDANGPNHSDVSLIRPSSSYSSPILSGQTTTT